MALGEHFHNSDGLPQGDRGVWYWRSRMSSEWPIEDFFAGLALQEQLMVSSSMNVDLESVAEFAYDMADAMMKVRNLRLQSRTTEDKEKENKEKDSAEPTTHPR